MGPMAPKLGLQTACEATTPPPTMGAAAAIQEAEATAARETHGPGCVGLGVAADAEASLVAEGALVAALAMRAAGLLWVVRVAEGALGSALAMPAVDLLAARVAEGARGGGSGYAGRRYPGGSGG